MKKNRNHYLNFFLTITQIVSASAMDKDTHDDYNYTKNQPYLNKYITNEASLGINKNTVPSLEDIQGVTFVERLIANIDKNIDLTTADFEHLQSKIKINPSLFLHEVYDSSLDEDVDSHLIELLFKAIIQNKPQMIELATLLDVNDVNLDLFCPFPVEHIVRTHHSSSLDSIDVKTEIDDETYPETALCTAVRCNNREIINLLLNKGFDINLNGMGCFEGICLHHASFLNNPSMIRFLLSKGATINIVDDNKENSLHKALRNGQTKTDNGQKLEQTILTLLDAGINVNAQNEDGDTPLLLAILYKEFNIIPLLLSYKADPKIKNNAQISAFDVACKFEYKDMINLFLKEQATNKRKRAESI